ncbi:prohead protease/major capsid protein fusion protein [Rhizobium sp. SL86]|uniref:prohead protease/major capsid protein fusion protein n=1 Tax=Rhizobium sp. SL86 TaxID=2995148 RepID=UPI0022768FDF|nr:prohead protease/major capsid protein fusion protein [Rhizobium sp. SL86]MCY1664587.1 HK97 family phage prohead protease [Rhizobium sp. SL86]
MAKSATRKAPDTDNLRRNWSFKPDTLDEEQRTVWAVAATETPVRTWYGSELLRCQRTAIDAGRMKLLPVIDTHDRSSILNTLGQVVEHQIEGRSLLVKIAFADSERGRHAFDLVRSGIVNKVSVGYRIHDYEEQRASDGSTLLTATRWEPIEVSLVSVPADPNATIRGVTMAGRTGGSRRAAARDQIHDQQGNELENERGALNDDDDDDGTRTVVPRTRAFQRQLDDLQALAIRNGLRSAEIEDEFDGVRSIDEARNIVFRMLDERTNRTRTSPIHGGGDRPSDADQLRGHVVDVLAARLSGGVTPEGNPFRSASLIEVGRSYLEAQGVSVRGWNDADVAGYLVEGRGPNMEFGVRSHTTSDFPLLLQAAGNRALLDRYTPMASPIKRLSHQRDVKDFRRMTFIRPGEAPRLEKVPEGGEVKYGTLKESGQGLKIDTYAKMFALTRQAIINDDLGAFTDFLSAFAQSAAETEGDLLFGVLSANSYGGATMDDTLPLFHADHGNLAASGSTIDEASVTAARTAMRLQKNINGTGTAGVTPAVILVGPKMETVAEKFVASISATSTSNVNPFAGKLRVEVENRYDGFGWWLFAEPQQRPALVHGYLSGQNGPQVESQNGWNVLGTEMRCVLDFGCAPFDFRAAYFNPWNGS